MIKLMVFLGNPGLEYRNTRHNAAWLCCERIEELRNASWQQKFKGSWTSSGSGDEKVIFLKPETFMNKSGESAGSAASFFKVKPHEILAVHDDLEMNFGQIGFRTGGGLGGHNGLRSLAEHLGTKDFHRFRIGIGRPVHGSVSSWVTGRFSPEEEIHLSLILDRSAQMIMSLPGKEVKTIEQKKIQVIQ